MLNNLKPQPADKILALVQMYKDDPRETKIDLGVGVYKNAEGVTPVMRAVKAAERRIVESQETKAYTSLAGDPAFSTAMRKLILAESVDSGRVAAVATPGGTGAVRQGLELMQYADRASTIWISNPTWPNHPSIIKYLGVPMREYRYFDGATRGVDFAGMMDDLKGGKRGDLVLLHGCCYNPTGANLTAEQWNMVAELLERTGAVPFVDIAYQGFGDGLEEDGYGTRLLASKLPEVIIAASCSKTFGVYRERTGLFLAKRLPKFLDYFERVLQSNSKGNPQSEGRFLIGAELTYVDLSVAQVMAGLQYAFPRAMTGVKARAPGLVELQKQVFARPNTAAYVASTRRLAFNEDGVFRRYPELDLPGVE